MVAGAAAQHRHSALADPAAQRQTLDADPEHHGGHRMARLVDGGGQQVVGTTGIFAARLGEDVGHPEPASGQTGPPPRAADQPLDVRPRGAEQEMADRAQVLVRQRVGQMLAQDGRERGGVGHADLDVAVEAAAADQGRIEPVWIVAGAQDDHARAVLYAVDLGQERVDDLGVPFRVVLDPCPVGERVNLVDENDCGRAGLCVLEALAHGLQQVALVTPAGPDPAAVGAGDQRHAAGGGQRAGEHGLACPGRSAEQQPAVDVGPCTPARPVCLEVVPELEAPGDRLVHAVDALQGGSVADRWRCRDRRGSSRGLPPEHLPKLQEIGVGGLARTHREPQQARRDARGFLLRQVGGGAGSRQAAGRFGQHPGRGRA